MSNWTSLVSCIRAKDSGDVNFTRKEFLERKKGAALMLLVENYLHVRCILMLLNLVEMHSKKIAEFAELSSALVSQAETERLTTNSMVKLLDLKIYAWKSKQWKKHTWALFRSNSRQFLYESQRKRNHGAKTVRSIRSWAAAPETTARRSLSGLSPWSRSPISSTFSLDCFWASSVCCSASFRKCSTTVSRDFTFI